MQSIKLQIESYLFESPNGQFRAAPFYELAYDEIVIYENGQPKYLLEFNRHHLPIIQDILKRVDTGENLEDIVCKFGKSLGKEWTIRHNINAIEIPESEQIENIELLLLEDLSEMFIS